MVHPTRGFRTARRLWRRHPNRTNGALWSKRSSDQLVEFNKKELFWGNVAKRDAEHVANVHDRTRTWKVPVSALGDVEIRTGYRLRISDGTLWEILSVNLRSAQHVWHCVCVEMPEGAET